MNIENRLHSIASGMEYPPTPDIASRVSEQLYPSTRSRFISRKLAWSLTIIFVLVSSIMLVPPARAAIIEFIQIGIVRIFPQEVESTPETIVIATPESIIPAAATPTESVPMLIPFLDQIAGETELNNVQAIAPYPILFPAYPVNLRQPDHVYVQDADGVMTILVWTDPEEPKRVMMSLHFIPAGHWAINKFGPVDIEEVEVNNKRAIWAVGPYPLIMDDGRLLVERLINGHVLIWENDGITYRLETALSLEEAIKIAESLEPIP